MSDSCVNESPTACELSGAAPTPGLSRLSADLSDSVLPLLLALHAVSNQMDNANDSNLKVFIRRKLVQYCCIHSSEISYQMPISRRFLIVEG